MLWIVLLVLIFAFLLSSTFRCALSHPIKLVHNGVKDGIGYIKYKKVNNAEFGYIRGYIAEDSKSFGCGKTLSSVNYLCDLYWRYNNKKVWDDERKKFVTQKVHILSNVRFSSIPFELLVSLKQFVKCVNDNYERDQENDTFTVTYMLIDEASSQMNSREFKTNFDPLFIKTLLTSRHVHASIIFTSQRSNMVDALLRQCTNTYVACNKLWRFQRLNFYDAYEIETAQTPAAVEPFTRRCWFVENFHFDNYNTYEMVGDLQKACESGAMLSEEQIISYQCNQPGDTDNLMQPSKKLRKRWRQRK